MLGSYALAEAVGTTHSTPQSTKHRLRAIRLSGSPASVDASGAVKAIGISAGQRGVSVYPHPLWITSVDNYSSNTAYIHIM